jgi:peptide/nickel transport system permease protein
VDGLRATAPLLLKRLLLTILTLVAISIVVYVATLVIPTDPARVALGKTATEDQLAAFRHAQGLDRGVVQAYLFWASRFVRGDWGSSVLSQVSVATLVLPSLVRTAILAVAAFVIAFPISLGLGMLAGRRVGSKLDRLLSATVLTIAALPEFIIAVVLLLLLAVYWPVFPISSAGLLYADPGTALAAFALPAITLALVVIPHMTRQSRVVIAETMTEQFVRSGQLRGLSDRALMFRHVLPSAAGRIVNVGALNLAELIAGVVVVETVFAFPGIGRGMVEAVSGNDLPVVQAIALIIGTSYVLINFVADALVVLLNPRLRRGATR